MNKTLTLIILWAMAQTSWAVDTLPYCRINQTGAIYSGFVIENNEDHLLVLTVAHGLDGPAQVEFALDNNAGFIGLPGRIIKKDKERDLGLIKVNKIVDITTKPLELGMYPDAPNTVAIKGFVAFSFLKQNLVTFNDRTTTSVRSNTDEVILRLVGKGYSGMSGAPVEYQQKFFGVQSAGSSTSTIAVSRDQIILFLGR